MSKDKEPVYWNNKLISINLNYFEISRYANLFEKSRKLKGNQLHHICIMIALLAISKQILKIHQNLFLY